MIGVVVWSNGSREKAIIWCEDQATLAYLQGQANFAGPGAWPQPGALVELDTQTVGNLRHALSVSILSEQRCPELPQLLAETQPAPRPVLRVVSGQDAGAAASAMSRPVGVRPTAYQQPRSGAAR